jgi:hypothetical protein
MSDFQSPPLCEKCRDGIWLRRPDLQQKVLELKKAAANLAGDVGKIVQELPPSTRDRLKAVFQHDLHRYETALASAKNPCPWTIGLEAEDIQLLERSSTLVNVDIWMNKTGRRWAETNRSALTTDCQFCGILASMTGYACGGKLADHDSTPILVVLKLRPGTWRSREFYVFAPRGRRLRILVAPTESMRGKDGFS